MEKTQLYGLFLGLVSLLCAGALALRVEKKARYTVPLWAALCVICGLLGARLVYWLVNFEVYFTQLKNPLSFFWFRDGGLSMTGALLGAALGTVLARALGGKKAGLSLPGMMDALAAPVCLMICFERLLEWLLLDMGFGPEMQSAGIFTVTRAYGPYLNTALLSAVAAFIMALWLLPFKGKRAGDCFLLFLLFYGLTQTLFESLRTDAHMMWNFVHAQMLFAVLMAAFASAVFARRRHKLLQSLALSLLAAGLIVALEFALDGRIKVPFDFLIPYAKRLWYGLYLLVLALYAWATVRFFYRGHKEAAHA